MADKETNNAAIITRPTLCAILVGALFILGCATTRYQTAMPISVTDADRTRCEQFARSEADAIKDTRGEAVLGAIGGSLFFAGGAPYAFLLFGVPMIAAHASEYSKAHAAFYNQALRECLDPVLVEADRGPLHPNVAASMIALAARYRTAQKFPEAEELYHRAIVIQEKTLGPEHTELANTLEAHAAVLARMDRQLEAESVVIRYQAIRTKITERQVNMSQESK